ncbi:hypothetical protein KUTeg_019762 [Tegillarca granosa]|uniref:RNA helicase n=1 Tax=Tegillarca granosa TaxID=220873 RepID=A0ABQ9EDE4_TEGGR|nr:hypothetical protein KUTeg_019762 [Tegillarca granosa]
MATANNPDLNEIRRNIRANVSLFVKLIYPSEILDFIPSISDEVVEIIREKESNSRIEAARHLMKIVIERYDVFIKRIFQTSPSSSNNEYNTYCEFIFNRIRGDLIRRVNPFEILEDLYSRKCLNIEDKEHIGAHRDTPVVACREMFVRLPKRQINWALHLFEVLGKNGYDHLVTKADPSASNEECLEKGLVFSSYASQLDKTEVKIFADNEREDRDRTMITENVSYIGSGYTSSKYAQANIENLGINSSCEEKLDTKKNGENDSECGSDDEKAEHEASEKLQIEGKPVENKLRSYQQELADKALLGKNTIICADTNSGKTRVALYIANRILESPGRGNRKVVFMARTNPLVCLLSKDDLNSTKMGLLVPDYDVFFMTPQILVNNLKGDEVKTAMFCLIILDECHHTDKGEPYNTLMRHYIKQKTEKPNEPRPQVIGLTATIGVGNANSDRQAVDHMLKICANLDVETIATVEDENNIEEMRKFTSRPREERKSMEERKDDPCKKVIVETMRKIEEVLDPSLKANMDLQDRINERPLNDYESKKYQQWIVVTKDKSACIMKHDKTRSRQIVSSLEHLLNYNEALDINYLMNVKDVLEYLTRKFEKETSQPDCLTYHEKCLITLFEDTKEKLKRLIKISQAENPNLNTLVELLRKEFHENGLTSRGMVFVQTRATAFALSEHLNSKLQNDGIKCKPFTGNKSSESAEGMGESEKKLLLENFKSGEVKLLVSTSVGSEGIDIPECNIILKYNFSGNEINVIQMQGRLRKEGGKAIYFSNYGTQVRDTINMQKAAMMYRALEMLKNMEPSERMRRILEYQRQDMSSEAIKQLSKDIHQAEKPKIEFRLKCFRCKTFAVDGDKIRKFQVHHTVTDRTFFDRIKKVPLAKTNTFDNITKHSKIYCKNCPQDWGVIFIIDDQEVPVIKSDPFVFESTNTYANRDRRYKKWKDVPYYLEPIEKEEMLELLLPFE